MFSPDGRSVAYPAKLENGKWALFVNDHPGPAYPDVGSDVSFVGGQPKYFAFPAGKQIVELHGDRALGPYDTSYHTVISDNGDHYMYWAKRGAHTFVVVDDKEGEITGPVGSYAISNRGVAAYSYKNRRKIPRALRHQRSAEIL